MLKFRYHLGQAHTVYKINIKNNNESTPEDNGFFTCDSEKGSQLTLSRGSNGINQQPHNNLMEITLPGAILDNSSLPGRHKWSCQEFLCLCLTVNISLFTSIE